MFRERVILAWEKMKIEFRGIDTAFRIFERITKRTFGDVEIEQHLSLKVGNKREETTIEVGKPFSNNILLRLLSTTGVLFGKNGGSYLFKVQYSPKWFDTNNLVVRVECKVNGIEDKDIGEFAIGFRHHAINLASVLRTMVNSLTGIYNRDAFFSIARHVFHTKSGIFAIVDLDCFKEINDEFGHPAGDSVLQKIAFLLAKEKGWVVGRLGGDEFGVVTDDPAKVFLDKLKKIYKEFSSSFNGMKKYLSFSCGGAWFEALMHPEYLYVTADMLLYKAKEEGKGKAVILGKEDVINIPLKEQKDEKAN